MNHSANKIKESELLSIYSMVGTIFVISLNPYKNHMK